MKYKKKPVVIEAIQLKDQAAIDEMIIAWPEFYDKWNFKNGEFCIRTLEGEMIASIGDFVIKGVKGEFYPCKPDIFSMTYEAAEPHVHSQVK